ncbi:MAG: matrixin family metalloprotease, partial [Acidobacteriota bacterium]
SFIGVALMTLLPAFGGSRLRVAGIPLKLPGNKLVLHVSESIHMPPDENGKVSGVDPRETSENIYRLVRDAARAWTKSGKSSLSIQVERTQDQKLSESNLNLVTFTDTEPFDTGMCDKTLYIACTLVFHNDDTGEIPMVKIAFNPYMQHSSLGRKGAHDLGVVLLHEMGHAIGLDHSAALDAIMSPVVELEIPTGSVSARRLSSDDLATVASAYPLPEPAVPASFLTGAVTREGLPVAKAHVMAFDSSGRKTIAGLTSTDGRFELQVEPGDYRLAVEPLDGPIMPVSTWSDQPAPDVFASLWWTRGGGSSESGDTVAIAEGESRQGLDFSLTSTPPVNATTVGIVGDGGLYLGAAHVTVARGREYPLALTRTPPEGAARMTFTLASIELPTLPTVPASAPQLLRQRVRIPADAPVGSYTVTYESNGAIAFLPGALEVVTNPVVRSISWLTDGWFLITGEDLAPVEAGADGDQVPTQLAGISVRVSDWLAEVNSVSPTQIIARWPTGLVQDEAAISVVAGTGVSSEPVSLIVQ